MAAGMSAGSVGRKTRRDKGIATSKTFHAGFEPRRARGIAYEGTFFNSCERVGDFEATAR